jgi:uncharacterized repeat protein (TIGR03843 family)
MNDVSAFDLPAATLVELLETGDVEVEGRMPYSSNTTLLVHVRGRDAEGIAIEHRAIYKPGRGERPLWDFPPDLYKREVAMYRLARALDLTVIPPTALGNGPFGEGSFQAFVEADFSHHYFTLHEAGVGVSDLRQLCLIDLIANNTDRKSGHCLLGRDGRVYGIDNGLAFHAQWKLRTVLWDFVDQPIPDEDLARVRAFVSAGPPVEICALLDNFEIDAMMTRAAAVLAEGVYPADDTDGHRWPWPLV